MLGGSNFVWSPDWWYKFQFLSYLRQCTTIISNTYRDIQSLILLVDLEVDLDLDLGIWARLKSFSTCLSLLPQLHMTAKLRVYYLTLGHSDKTLKYQRLLQSSTAKWDITGTSATWQKFWRSEKIWKDLTKSDKIWQTEKNWYQKFSESFRSPVDQTLRNGDFWYQTIRQSVIVRTSECQTARLPDCQISDYQTVSYSQIVSYSQTISYSQTVGYSQRVSCSPTISYSQNISFPDCQTVSYSHSASYFQNIRFSDVQTIRWSVILRLPVISRLSDYQIVIPLDH